MESHRFRESKEREVAFFGGTFTRLSRDKMKEFLETVRPYVEKGHFGSVRISTRPDEIDEERLDLLKRFYVGTVELGVQSMDDEVLRLSGRGHCANDTVQSMDLLKKYGFKTGVQLMPGLPGDSEETFQRGVEKIVSLRPDMARLYPAIVIRGTKLADWLESGRYRPLSLSDAVRICSDSCMYMESRNIPVIRIGLMSSPSLLREGQILAGPWHTAFGFLVRSDIHQKRIHRFLPRYGTASEIGIRAPDREIPLVRGYENLGIREIEEKTGAKVRFVRPDDAVSSGSITVEKLQVMQ